MNSLNDIWNSVLAVLGQNLTATALKRLFQSSGANDRFWDER